MCYQRVIVTAVDGARIKLQGLLPGTPQTLGALRLVPLLRASVEGAPLRLARPEATVREELHETPGVDPDATVLLPHGMIVRWDAQGAPQAAFGSALVPPVGRRGGAAPHVTRVEARLGRREAGGRARWAPGPLCLEGLVLASAGAPASSWTALSGSPRGEALGRATRTTHEEALRMFEPLEGQCGLLAYAGDSLEFALVLPHPEDHLHAHRAIIEDLLAASLARYGRVQGPPGAPLKGLYAPTFDAVREAVASARRPWLPPSVTDARGLFPEDLTEVSRASVRPFTLLRLVTSLTRGAAQHVVEAVLRQDGALCFLLAFQLSEAQSRRLFTLRALASQGWRYAAAAARLRKTEAQLRAELLAAGYGPLGR